MSPQDTEHADHKRTFDLLREIGRFNHIGGWVYHPKTSTLRWTSVTYDIFGIDGSVKPGPYDAIEYFHPENRVAVEAAFRQALRDGTPYDFDLQITRPDGGDDLAERFGQSRDARWCGGLSLRIVSEHR